MPAGKCEKVSSDLRSHVKPGMAACVYHLSTPMVRSAELGVLSNEQLETLSNTKLKTSTDL